MTSNRNDLDQLRQELEFRREFDTVARLPANRLADRLAELRDRWLRGVGYFTRPIVYLVAVGLGLLLLYVWLEPKSLTDRPLGSLTVGELGNNLLWAILSCGGAFMMLRAFSPKTMAVSNTWSGRRGERWASRSSQWQW